MEPNAPRELAEEEMLRAVYRHDPAYDGQFYYSVTSTGIFCLPSCPSRQPRKEHIRFFATRDQALSQGFRPCKRCRSDLEGGRHTYEADLVEQVRALVEARLERVSIATLAAELALSPHHLMRLFRRVAGMSVHEFIQRRRVNRAQQLLRSREHSVLEVAAAVGFESVGAFYAMFRRITGLAPGEYRRHATEEVSNAAAE